MRTILYATDFSRASAPAFAAALAQARGRGRRLVVAHVLTPPSPFISGRPPASWVELDARARHGAERRLAALVARARRAGVRARGALLEGVPGEAIARRARRERADLIAIGTHGRSGLGRLFMGSVAARVLALAACPVLTVRGPARPR
jgi:nucleotide-binding universal stress UspA family protein